MKNKIAIFDIDDTLIKTGETMKKYVESIFNTEIPENKNWDFSDIRADLKSKLSKESPLYKEIDMILTDEWFNSFFNSKIGKTIPLESKNIYEIIDKLKSDNYKIIFLTSRPINKEKCTLSNMQLHNLDKYEIIHWQGSKLNFLDESSEYIIFEDAPHHIKDYLTHKNVKKIFFLTKSYNKELHKIKDKRLIENINYENIIEHL